MKKPVALVKDHDVIQTHLQRLDDLGKDCKERAKFLSRQLEKIKADGQKKADAIFLEIGAYCRARGMLPQDFSEERYHFHFDDTEELLLLCDGEDHNKNPLEAFIALLGK